MQGLGDTEKAALACAQLPAHLSAAPLQPVVLLPNGSQRPRIPNSTPLEHALGLEGRIVFPGPSFRAHPKLGIPNQTTVVLHIGEAKKAAAVRAEALSKGKPQAGPAARVLQTRQRWISRPSRRGACLKHNISKLGNKKLNGC